MNFTALSLGVICDLEPICQMPSHQESDSQQCDFSDSVILAVW